MDTTKIKSFFVNHFEKMVLAGVVGVSGFLIVRGFQMPHFTDQHDPTSLTQKARQVKSELDEVRTDAVLEGREPTLDVVARTKELDTPVDPSPYKLAKPMEIKRAGTTVRRQDPQLQAPKSIIATPFVTSIAWQNRSSDDPDDYDLFKLDNADFSEDDGRSRTRPRIRPRRRLGGNDDDEDDGGGLFGGNRANRLGGRDDDDDDGLGGSGPSIPFDNEFNFGATPRTANNHPPKPYLGQFIMGAAVVPHQAIHEAYDLALKDADAYSPNRDTPIYANMEVQRADVTKKSVDELAEDDWILIWTFDEYRKVAAFRWAGFAPEIVPPEYRDDRLSLWIPPVLIDDYRPYVTHPLIPMVSPSELEPEEEEEENRFDPGEEDLFGRGSGRIAAPDAGGGGLSIGGRGRRGGGMSIGGGGLRGGGNDDAAPVEYKLIRFFDFPGVKKNGPKPGAKYVYRIRFSVVDPNFSAGLDQSPKLTSLAPEVARRVIGLREKALQSGVRDYQRWSPWSEPTEPVSLPSLSQQYAGSVAPGTTYDWTVAGKRVVYPRNPPKGKVVTAQFDERLGTRIPMTMDVVEGAVLSKKGKAEVVDPIGLTIKELEETTVVNQTVVIDLDGGAPLEIIEGMNQPGSMLLYGSDGKLIVADEVSDLESYQIYSFADQRDEEDE